MLRFLYTSSVLFLSGLALAAPQTHDVVRLTLCGVKLDESNGWKEVKLYDPQNGYYLFTTGDCDGASSDLVLTSDRAFYDGDVSEQLTHTWKRVSLPHLRDGKGINIGTSLANVKQLLGRPQEVNYDPDIANKLTFIYRRPVFLVDRQKRGPQIYSGSYSFKNGRLYEIRYNVSDKYGEE